MEFEDLLKEAGDFGLYQILLIIFFLVPCTIVIPWIFMNAVFVSSTPDHWCYVPELETLDLSIEEIKRFTRPSEDPFCMRYDVNFTYLLQRGNLSVNNDWPVKKCDFGWSYDTMYYDETAVTKWDLVCGNEYYKSTIVSFVFVGVMIGTPLYSFLVDKCGRKKLFLGLSLLACVSELLSAFCPYLTLFLLLRVLIGSTMSSMYNCSYIMILELVRPNLRGRVNGIAINSWTVGMCTLPWVAYITRSWFWLTIVISVITGSFLLYFRFLPESPSWLISQEKYEEAANILGKVAKFNKKKVLPEHFLKVIQTLEQNKKNEDTQRSSPLDFFKYPNLRKRFLLSVLICITVSIPYYGLQVNVVNLGGNEFLNFFLVSIVELPAHLTAWWMLENLGRKKTIQLAYAVCAIPCLIPIFIPRTHANINVIVSIVAKAGSSAAFMSMFQLIPELFPTPLRGVGMGMTCTIGIGSTLIVPYIAQLEKYGAYIPFLIFSMVSFFAAICAIFLPETLNQNLPQTVDDVEKNRNNEKCNICGCNKKEYDLEKRKSSIFCQDVPVFICSKNIKEISRISMNLNI